MARSGPPIAELVLTSEEHEQLARGSRRAKSSQALAMRSRIAPVRGRLVDHFELSTDPLLIDSLYDVVGLWMPGTPKHRAVEFKKFLTKIENEVPDGLQIHAARASPST